jgi:NADPH:quinone reductase-like Zn-dependent oxidoreductase
MMRAIVWTAYGPPDVLQLKEVEQPRPAANEILVRVRATTVTAGEVEMRRSGSFNVLTIPLRLYFGVFRPRGQRIMGQELAGDVVGVGSDVTRFEVGDRICAHNGFRFGGYAEYATLPETGMIARVPEQVSYEQATTLPTAGLYARYFFERAKPQSGQSVLVNGGGGSIGSFTLQLAKRAGAVSTAVDDSGKLEFMRSLGADRVVDYTIEDFTDTPAAYDYIFDVIDKSSFRQAAKALKPSGVFLHSNLSLIQFIQRKLSRHRGGRSSAFVTEREGREGLSDLLQLVAAGELQVPIDRSYPLDAIADAHRYAETGQKKGHIVIAVSD